MSVDVLSARRAQIMKIVRATPGISTRELAQRVGISPDVADYHARRLARAGLLIRERTSMGILNFARLQGPDEEARRWACLPASVRAVLVALDAEPDSCVMHIVPMTSLRDGGVRWALYFAASLGFVETRRSDRRHFYRLSQAGAAIVRANTAPPVAARAV